jgi:predicted tellurium resistance membrane protein TerC
VEVHLGTGDVPRAGKESSGEDPPELQYSSAMDWIVNPEMWISLVTLTVLEIVLGIDNVVFIAILAGKLPREEQHRARQLGLGLALITRVLLLMGLSWIMGLKTVLFTVMNHPFTGRDLILFAGGMFLVYKATKEIHEKLEGEDGQATAKIRPSFAKVIVTILVLDIVFSLDSVITAVGMARQLGVMIAAVVLAVVFMLFFARQISGVIDQHPTLKILALSFLLLIGVVLIADGLGQHISKGYIYFAMAFSVCVELLNIRMRSVRARSVHLHQPYR